MRLIKLEILNLASLDRQGGEVINFEEGALKDSTIFSIVGPTGSGKSTILDAICLALYNRAPRYPKKKNDKKTKIEIFGTPDEGEKNRPAPTDNKNILTRGKKDAYSKLTFLANDETIYRAEWSVHRKTKNIDDPITALYKISIINGKQHEEEAEWTMLPQIIGLDYDQFLRTVLIAQGSFANFLTSNENERYELLEKLIGCEELYTTIARKIKRKKDEATDAYNQLAANFSAYDQDIIKDPLELQNLIERIKTLEEEDKKAKVELTKIADSLNWYTTEEKYVENITRFEEAFLIAQKNLEGIKQEVERLELHDKTLTAVSYYKEVQTAEKNILACDKDLQDLAGQMAMKEASLKQENATLTDLVTSATKAEQKLSTLKPHIDRARVIKGELSIAQRTVNEKTVAESEAKAALSKVTIAVDENKKAIGKAQVASDSADKELKKLKESIEEKSSDLQSKVQKATDAFSFENKKSEGLDATALQNAKSLADKKQNDLKDAIRIQKALAENKETVISNNEKSQSLSARNDAISQELSTLTIDNLSSELETLTKTHTLMTSENWQQHRAALNDDKPCPLCGSVHHPYANAKNIAPVVKGLKSIIDTKKKALDGQNARKSILDKEHSQNEGIIKELSKASEKLQKEQEKLTGEWSVIHETYPDWRETADELLTLKPSIDEKVQSADNALKNYNALMKRINALRAEKEKAEKAFVEYRQQADTKVKQTEKKLTDAQTLLQTEKGKTDNLVQQLNDKTTAYANAQKALKDANADVTAKQKSIKQEIGDKHPDIYEKELQNAKANADGAVQKKKDDIGKINEDIKGLKGKQETITKSRTVEQEKHRSNATILSQWLSSYNSNPDNASPLTTEDIISLSLATDNWEDIRSRQKNLSNAFTSAETTLKNEKKSHLDHQQKKPEQEKDALLSRKTELEGKSNNELVEAQARKQRHDAAKQQTGALGAQKDAAEQLKTEWEQISDAIGGVDGKTLRKIAQCYTLRFLVEHANVEIRKFNSRYELQQVKNSLGIRVIDHDRADDVRDVTSLSGGETFIVSLGLALGLSALSSRNISFENLFIDEGFGTLDPEALDSVIDSLAMLQTSQGKKVGVISHTNTMVERITTQIRIIKNGHSGSSHIEIYP